MSLALKIESVKAADIRYENVNPVAFEMNISAFAGLFPVFIIQGEILKTVDNNAGNTEKKLTGL